MKFKLDIDPDGVMHTTVIGHQFGRRFVAKAKPVDRAHDWPDFKQHLHDAVFEAGLKVKIAQNRASEPEDIT